MIIIFMISVGVQSQPTQHAHIIFISKSRTRILCFNILDKVKSQHSISKPRTKFLVFNFHHSIKYKIKTAKKWSMTHLEANNGPRVAYWGPNEWSVQAENTLIILQMRNVRDTNFMS